MKFISRFSLLVIALIFASGPALAQPNISDVLRQVPSPQPQQKAAPALPAMGEGQPLPPLKKLGGPKIKVNKLMVAGNHALPTRDLLALVQSAEGQELTLGDLEELAARITQYYRRKGYFVARAYIPEQEIRSGVVTIEVLEGFYNKLILKNKSLVKDPVLQKLLDKTLDHIVLSTKTTERTVLMMNNMPGVRVARAEVMPGDKVGTSDLAVGLEATPRVTGYGMADNYGTVYTGKKRFMGGIAVNSPSGRGDRLSASGLVTEGQYIKNYRLAYSTPLLSKGLRGEIALAKTTYQLTGAFAALDAVGNANTSEVNLTYPFRLTRTSSLEGGLNLSHRELTDQIRSTSTVIPKTADVATASLQLASEGALLGLAGKTTASASLTLGNLEINDATAQAIDAAGARTEGRYSKVNASVGRTIALRQRWTLDASLKAQKALYGKNLDGSEDMSVSGSGGVKAYPVSELAAENAYFFNAELQYALPVKEPFSIRLGLFTDVGRALMENQVSGEAGPRTLSDAGVGAYVNYNKFFSSLQVARRTDSPALSEKTPPARALLQVGISF
ncbi:MAG: ShlB/FhaC/HecB family hemolysin secretion/activation protein [Alphaproteobacteria bacterium]|nr:ShlB/FhaC/HecB family hemolysin secretion/activation protein [Alphaproteobacteria bacterium]